MTEAPQAGQPAPDFDLETDTGRVRLSDLKGKTVILYFYPKDDTPGCTTEAQGFSQAAADFAKAGAVIIGVLMFAIVPDDSSERTLAGAQASAGAAAVMLQRVIDESRESRNLKSLLIAGLVTVGAGALMLRLMWLLRKARRRIQAWLTGKTLAHADRLRIGGVDLVRRDGLTVADPEDLALGADVDAAAGPDAEPGIDDRMEGCGLV